MAQIDTGDLIQTYDDRGPRQGPVVLLIHGWPDDASTWHDLVPLRHDAGLRTIRDQARKHQAFPLLASVAIAITAATLHTRKARP